jgi:hypothetical protein
MMNDELELLLVVTRYRTNPGDEGCDGAMFSGSRFVWFFVLF